MSSPRRVKIVCTMGPACRDRDTLAAMLDAGMDVARFNMSHGTYEQHAGTVRVLRSLADGRRRPLALLQDLSGPKIRLGALKAPMELRQGSRLRLGDGAPETDAIPVQYENFASLVSVGDRLSLADGTFVLEVRGIAGGIVETEVIDGSGVLTSHKGVNLPHSARELVALTNKDREDLAFGLDQEFDWIALSFVRSARDAEQVRSEMTRRNCLRPLLAKIEKPEALASIDEIVRVFDGLMVARGDLGVETSLERVPGIQKDLIRRANRNAKPVITATQMLLSMVSNPRPTRAEVADITAAVLDGTDAVMLSEETAQGAYPVEAVRTLATVCAEAETLRLPLARLREPPGAGVTPDEGIARIVPELARMIGAKLIVAPTVSGTTARRIAAARPEIPILALSSNPNTVRALALTWGVTAQPFGEVTTTDALVESSRRAALAAGLAAAGDRIVITAGSPTGVRGSTDLIKVEQL